MATIFPFRAIRAPRDKVGLVASRSYINYTKSDLKARLIGNPYTFLHVLNPGFSKTATLPRSRKERFEKIKLRLQSFMDQKHLFKEEKAVFYIYRQDRSHASFNGLICGISVDDYTSGHIKIHEQTLSRREQLFKQYLEMTRFNSEPVLLTHAPIEEVDAIIAKTETHFADYDFRTTDTVRHRLWVIHDEADIKAIQKAYKTLDSVYLADGHHRSASSVLLAQSDRKKNNFKIGSRMFMALNVAENQLRILAFDRMVKDLNGYSSLEILENIGLIFELKKVENGFRPDQLHVFGIYLEGQWYRAKLKTEYHIFDRATDALDTKILTKFILQPILGIENQKTDPRIGFIGGYDDVDALEKQMVKEKFKIGFSLCPVGVEQLKAVADAGEIMPPKSTWIEPKLRTGLTIMDLDDDSETSSE